MARSFMTDTASHNGQRRPPATSDRDRIKTCLRVLDAETDGADWQDIARIVLNLDVTANPGGARSEYLEHLAEARRLVADGYRDLIEPAPDT